MEGLTTLVERTGTAINPNWATLISIVLVVAITVGALRLLRVAVRSVARGILQRKEPERELAQKAKTLSQVVETTGRIVILAISGLTILSLVWRDITPLLASAGIAGVAVGFGAQNLIKDWLGGFFILLENQYSVDDVIKVGEHTGTVEKLELRRTVLRSADGSAIVIPNGEVRVVKNLTKGWSRAVVDVGISYEDDVDRAMEVLRRVGEELAGDEVLGKLILEQPEVLGVEDLGEYQMTLRLQVKTQPAKQWAVARALRIGVRKAFEQEGIRVPYPHQVSLVREPSPSVVAPRRDN